MTDFQGWLDAGTRDAIPGEVRVYELTDMEEVEREEKAPVPYLRFTSPDKASEFVRLYADDELQHLVRHFGIKLGSLVELLCVGYSSAEAAGRFAFPVWRIVGLAQQGSATP